MNIGFPSFLAGIVSRVAAVAGCSLLLASTAVASIETPPNSGPRVPGNRIRMTGDLACAPENAPDRVKRAIWATNYIVRKPYVWGGGHGSVYDRRGYDCSGSISFLLYHAGALDSPTVAREFQNYGEPGEGRWITIYARDGHVFAVVAGVRLDTTGSWGDEGPRWRRNDRVGWGFTARHPAGM